MDSWPPAIMIRASPQRIAWAAICTALRPEPQTLLMVNAGTLWGRPPCTAACRAGFWPQPGPRRLHARAPAQHRSAPAGRGYRSHPAGVPEHWQTGHRNCQWQFGWRRRSRPLAWRTSSKQSDEAARIEATPGLDNHIYSAPPVESVFDQAVDHRGVGQRGSVTEIVQLVAGNLAQDAAHDLAGAGLRQSAGDLNIVRPGKGAHLLADRHLELGENILGQGNALHRHDIGIDCLALDIVRTADYGGLGYPVVENQGAFHFRSTDAVARDVQHVINPAGDPVVAIGIPTRTVSGEIDALVGAEVGFHQALLIAVHGTDLARPGLLDHQVAIGGTFELVAIVVYQCRDHTEQRAHGGAGLEVASTGQRGDQDGAGLGLPPGIDNRAATLANDLVVPFPYLGVDRLADTAEQAQGPTGRTLERFLTQCHQ